MATLFGVVLIVTVTYLAKPVLVPISLAVLLTFILTPLVTMVERRVRGRVPAVLIVVLTTLLVTASIGWVVGLQVGKLARELPDHGTDIKRKIDGLRSHGGIFSALSKMGAEISGRGEPATTRPVTPGKPPTAVDALAGTTAAVAGSPVKSVLPPVPTTQPNPPAAVANAGGEPQSAAGKLVDYAATAVEYLADAGLVLILVIYLLIRREDMRNRMIGLLGDTRLAGTTRVTVETASRVSKLLLAQLCVNASFGLVFGLVLTVIGVPYVFLWGFLTAVLRFIPYIGTWLAASGPIVLSFAVAPGWGQPIAVFVSFLLLDLVTANVVEPLLFGHSAGVSPVALLLAAVFWTWIWGPVGLVLSTPITICLVVLGQHVPKLRVLWLLLGDRPPLPPAVAVYQRLLAGDKAEAEAVVAEQVSARGAGAVADDVLLPALRTTRREREAKRLTPADETFILDAAAEIVGRLGPAAGDGPVVAGARVPTVLAIPSHHRAEELTLQLVGQALAGTGCRIEAVTTRVLPVEIESRIERDRPDVVFVAVMPPGGLVQARYLCRRLGKRFADVKIVVGYWGKVRDFDRLLVRMRSAGASYVTTSVSQTKSQLTALLGTDRPQA